MSSSTPVVDPPLCLLTKAHELLLKANKVYFDRGNQDASEIFHIIGKLTSIISRNREIESSNSNNHRHDIHNDSALDLTEDNTIKEEEKKILINCPAKVSNHKEKPCLSGNIDDLLDRRSSRTVAIMNSPGKRKRQNNEDQNFYRKNIIASTAPATQSCRGSLMSNFGLNKGNNKEKKNKKQLLIEAKARVERDRKFLEDYKSSKMKRLNQIGLLVPSADHRDGSETVFSGPQWKHRHFNHIFLWRNAIACGDWNQRLERRTLQRQGLWPKPKLLAPRNTLARIKEWSEKVKSA